MNSDIHIIKQAVCDDYRINIDDMNSECRFAKYVRPRHVAMYLVRVLLGESYPVIAMAFNKLDHTTVMHAVNIIKNHHIPNDPILRARIVRIKAKLSELDIENPSGEDALVAVKLARCERDALILKKLRPAIKYALKVANGERKSITHIVKRLLY